MLRTTPSNSLPYIFFWPHAPYAFMTPWASSLSKVMARLFFWVNLWWETMESGLIPKMTAPSFANFDLSSENSRASTVQPLVLSLG